jgi:hypothetical protein
MIVDYSQLILALDDVLKSYREYLKTDKVSLEASIALGTQIANILNNRANPTLGTVIFVFANFLREALEPEVVSSKEN